MDFTLEALAPAATANPLTLRDKLLRGSPVEITTLASTFADAAGDADYARVLTTRAANLTKAGYVVDNKGVEPAEARQTKQLLGRNVTAMRAIASTLNQISNDLQGATNAANTAVTTVRGQLAAFVGRYNADVANLRNHQPPLSQVELDAAVAQLDRSYRATALVKVNAAGQAVRKAVTGYETTLAAAQRRLASLGYAAPGGLNTAATNPAAVPVPPAGTDPTVVAAWWKGLDKPTHDYLIGHQHRMLGNTDGVPAYARDLANRNSLAEDLRSPNTRVRENAEAINKALLAQAGAHNGAPVQLYAYERDAFPHTSSGRYPTDQTNAKYAIAVGNVDLADTISVVVPGVDTNTQSAGALAWKAGQVYDATLAADPTRSTASVAWFGYDPPNKNRDYLDGVFDTWGEGHAEAGAARLATDLAGIRATNAAGNGHQPQITAIGHSYGSTVVSRAAHDHQLEADNIVLLGSIGAGQGIDSVDDYPPQYRDRIFAGSEVDDKVRYQGMVRGHGGDPSSAEFGAYRFEANTPKYGDDAHGSYFDYGSASVVNLGSITAGEGVTRPQYNPNEFDKPPEPPLGD